MPAKIDAFIDIETEEWDRFVCGGLTTDGETVSFFWDENQFGRALLALQGEIWAWNGGLYDTVWFADWAQKFGIKFQSNFAGTRIVGLTTGDINIRDSVALIPMSLQKASVAIGPAISKETGFDCRCGRNCGGYCRIRRDMPPHERSILERYLHDDVCTGWKVMERIFDHAERAGYELTSTVGGSVWRTAKATLDIGPATWLTGKDYEQARAGYFGGRVFVGHLLASSGHRADIHSAYPDALSRVALPYGEYATLRGQRAAKALENERPGIYECTVSIPESAIPPLPWRSPGERILYPVGKVRGSWTYLELRYAVDECGCRLETVHSAIVWSDEDVLFAEFMSQIFAVRSQFADNKAIAAWQKWFGNSFTGKLAERPDKERLFCNLEVSEIKYCNPANPRHWELGCRWGRCSGRCGAMSPLAFDGNLWLQKYWRLSDCSHIQWAAYLTAATRIKWHRAAMTQDKGRGVIYGDTDSIYSVDRLPPDLYGDGLGTFGYEGALNEWLCLAPKTYRYTDENGKVHCRGKGLPNIEPDVWEAFRRGDTVVTDRGVMGLRSAARANEPGVSLFRRKLIKRKRHGDLEPGHFVGDRRICADGIHTRAITVDEQLRRESEPKR
jgi:hypothetical protein